MKLYISVILFGFGSLSFAGDNPEKTYTLEEAIRTALRFNHDLAVAYLEVERADARVREAWGYALPRLDFSTTYSRALKKPVFFLPDFDDIGSGRVVPVEIGSNHSVDVNVKATQTLFNAAVFVGVGAAGVYSRAAREMFRAKQIETVTDATRAFYGVIVAREVTTLMEETLKNAEENFRNARVLNAQGLVSDYDRLRAEVAVANLRPEVIRAANNLQRAVNHLKIVLGRNVDGDIGVEGDLTAVEYPPSLLADSRNRVLENNPSLVALRLQVEVNEAFVSAERSAYLPTLAAFANYQFQAQKNDLRIGRKDFIGSALVGATLSMNIFTGFQTNARVEQTRIEVRKTQEQIAALEKNLRTTLESLRIQLEQAQLELDGQSKAVELAERGYRIANTRYKEGTGTQLEVQDAQLALTQARVNRIRASYNYLMTTTELNQILGILPGFVKEGTPYNED